MIWFCQTRRVACVGGWAQETVRTIGCPRDGVVVPHVAVVALFETLRVREDGEGVICPGYVSIDAHAAAPIWCDSGPTPIPKQGKGVVEASYVLHEAR